MQLSLADQIWNRAALESGGPAAREGDRALAALLLAHGMVMNGGVGHALEVLSPTSSPPRRGATGSTGLRASRRYWSGRRAPPRMKLMAPIPPMGESYRMTRR